MSCRVEFVNGAVAEGWENCLSFKNENKLLDNNDFRNGKMKFQTRIFFNEDEQEYDLKLDFSEDSGFDSFSDQENIVHIYGFKDSFEEIVGSIQEFSMKNCQILA